MVLSFALLVAWLMLITGALVIGVEQGAIAQEARSAADFLGMTAASLLLAGIVVVPAALSIAVGRGIFFKSAKWAFILGAVLYGIGLALNLIGFSILGILISGALFTYCLLRLTGNLGPRPA